MGAANIFDVGLGRTPQEALAELVYEAAYEYGHDTYSGTIAAKHGDPVMCPPAKGRMSAERIYELALDAGDTRYVKSRDAWEPTADARKAREALGKWLTEGAAAGSWRVSLEQFLTAFDDKWSGGVCVEVTGAKATEYRKRAGKAGTRQRVFAFFGFAPC